MQIIVKFRIMCIGFSSLNYIGEKKGPSRRFQTVWTKILKGDECLNRKNISAICVLNFGCDLRVTNHRPSHFTEKAMKMTFFSEIINDYAPIEVKDK